jgi:hypothetical protein
MAMSSGTIWADVLFRSRCRLAAQVCAGHIGLRRALIIHHRLASLLALMSASASSIESARLQAVNTMPPLVPPPYESPLRTTATGTQPPCVCHL